MKARRKYTDDQIVAILQEHKGGVTAKEVIRRHGISLDADATQPLQSVEVEPGRVIVAGDEASLLETCKDLEVMNPSVDDVSCRDPAWIGTKATVLRGSTVGHGSVLAAHTVVRGPVTPLSVVGGVPGRVGCGPSRWR